MTWFSVADPRSSIDAKDYLPARRGGRPVRAGWGDGARKTPGLRLARELSRLMAARKWVYQFSEGSAKMRDLLGGKGAGAAEMTRAGVAVPPGFTITTEACRAHLKGGGKF